MSLFEGIEQEGAPEGAEGAAPEGAAPAAEGAPQPAADAPWWERAVPGKWKSEEEALKGYAESSREAKRLLDESKAAAEKIASLEKLTQGVIGAPVGEDGKPADYQFKLPEGVEFQPELLGKLTEFARSRNLSQDVMQSALEDIVIPWQVGLEMGMREQTKAAAMEYFRAADDGALKQAVSGLHGWAAALLQEFGADALADLEEAGASAGAIKTLDRLRQRLSGATVGQGISAAGSMNRSEYEAILSQPGWQANPENVKRVVAFLNATAPDDMAG